ncbi:MAG: AMP-binding protein [Leptospirales bacterium]|nr:AMP-binding protein [Leptospirales bacterium]
MPARIQTLGQYLRRQCHLYEELCALRFVRDGRAQEISYGKYFQLARQIGAGLWRRGFRPTQRALIVGSSSPEWALAFAAVQLAGGVDASLEENSDAALCIAAMKRCDARWLFSDRQDLLEAVQRVLGDRAQYCLLSWSQRKRKPLTLADLRGRGEALRAFARFMAWPSLAGRNSPASVIFKRQAPEIEGLPPGATLSHGAILQSIQGFASAAPIQEGDLILSGVAFSRGAGRLALLFALHSGAPLAVSSPSAFFRDSRRFRPSLAFATPDVLLRLARSAREGELSESPALLIVRRMALLIASLSRRAWNRISGDSPPPPSRRLELASLLSAISGATALLPFNLLSDFYLRRSLRPRLGGRLRAVFTGGQRLPAQLEDLFHALDIALLEGYWLAEAGMICACRTLEFTGQRRRLAPGTVGPTLPGIELKLIDARGEDVSVQPWRSGRIYLRGESLMLNYIEEPERSAACLDSEGWLSTEDIGRITNHGDLQLLGRRTLVS